MQERIKKAKSGFNELKKFQNLLQSKLDEENKKKIELLNYKENQEKLQNDLKNFDEEIGLFIVFVFIIRIYHVYETVIINIDNSF